MSCRSKLCGRSSSKMLPSTSTSPTYFLKVEDHLGNISSTCSTQCSLTSCGRCWSTPISRGCLPPVILDRESPSRSHSSGRISSAPCLISRVSQTITCISYVLFLTEKPGKTLHLLKARSKPIQSGRKRKKVAILGTFA